MQRAGSLVAVTAGAALVDVFSRSVAFTGLAAVGVVGVLVATAAPALTVRREREEEEDSALRRAGCGARDITQVPVVEEGGRNRAARRFWDLAVARLPEGERHLRWRMLSINLMRGATGFGARLLARAGAKP